MKHKILATTIICLLFAGLSIASAGPIRIMPLGDSITLGYSASVTNNDYTVGYRQKLYWDLVDGGYDVNFVGSMSSGSFARPVFDINHEGHGGWCADGCFPSPPYYDILDNVYAFLTNNPADVVLLHIGTNDISNNNGNAAEVGGILDEIKRYSPDIAVVLARIISRNDGKAAQTTAFNNAVAAMALTRIANGDKIVLVDMENALTYPADLDDSLHPNQTGYEKMADVWFNAMTPLVTVHKIGTGMGTITSNPAAIDCGNLCSNSFLVGTVVTLTAKADNGYFLSDWDGCEVVSGNTCTVIVNSDRTLSANFQPATQVKLLSPNDGKAIPAGSQYTIRWEAPSEAVKYKVTGSKTRRIGTGIFTGTSAIWDVPLLSKNRTNCFVKVTAYDSANRKIGYDTSDSNFTIEVVSITSPNQGNPCTGGQVCPITWTKSKYVPAASIELYYSLRNGTRWIKISDVLSGDALSYDWGAPNVSEPNTKCKIKIVLRDSAGKIVGRHISEGNFTIQPAP